MYSCKGVFTLPPPSFPHHYQVAMPREQTVIVNHSSDDTLLVSNKLQNYFLKKQQKVHNVEERQLVTT